jgi:hypothetical protein
MPPYHRRVSYDHRFCLHILINVIFLLFTIRILFARLLSIQDASCCEVSRMTLVN